jgi:hypothetical protein
MQPNDKCCKTHKIQRRRFNNRHCSVKPKQCQKDRLTDNLGAPAPKKALVEPNSFALYTGVAETGNGLKRLLTH